MTTPTDQQETTMTDTEIADDPDQTQPINLEQTEAEDTTEQEVEPEAEPRSAEAKRYRLQLREVQSELGDTQGKLEQLQEQVVAGILEDTGTVTEAALWASGTTLTDLIDETGTVNPDAVKQAGQAAATKLGIGGPRKPQPDHSLGRGSTLHTATGWADAFKP